MISLVPMMFVLVVSLGNRDHTCAPSVRGEAGRVCVAWRAGSARIYVCYFWILGESNLGRTRLDQFILSQLTSERYYVTLLEA